MGWRDGYTVEDAAALATHLDQRLDESYATARVDFSKQRTGDFQSASSDDGDLAPAGDYHRWDLCVGAVREEANCVGERTA